MAYNRHCDSCQCTLDPEEHCDCHARTASEPSDFDKLLDEIANEYMREG